MADTQGAVQESVQQTLKHIEKLNAELMTRKLKRKNDPVLETSAGERASKCRKLND